MSTFAYVRGNDGNLFASLKPLLDWNDKYKSGLMKLADARCQ